MFYMRKRPGHSPVNRVPQLAGMILIFIYMRSFVPVCRDENVTSYCFSFCCYILVTVPPSLLPIRHSFLAYQLQNLFHKSHLWFVSWDVIYHKSASSKTRFFPYLCYTKLLPLLSSYHFHRNMVRFCFHELFYTKWCSTSSLIWLLFVLRFSSNAFL